MKECRPGMVLNEVVFTEQTQPDGQTKVWCASQKIGAIFGSVVEGGIQAFGKTKQQALENLKKEQDKLYQSLWI